MRMPIFSYFLVVGAVLTGLLIWFGDDGDLKSAPLRTSQQVGIPKPFKGEPETMPDISAVNFAAAREPPAAERERTPEKPAKVAAQPNPRQKTVVRTWQGPAQPPARNWAAAESEHGTLGIH